MVETPNRQESSFIVSFRLKPTQAFAGLKAKITTGDGYEISFHADMVWIRFDATSDEWPRRLDSAKHVLRILLSILTIQLQYPFDLESIQWIEDKPRDETGGVNYVLGRLGPDLTVQNEIPSIKIEHIQKSEPYAHLASINAYYRYALLDYSFALTIPREAIVFFARSLEWILKYFETINRSLSKEAKAGSRKLMRDRLKLPNKYLNQFFTIANETVLARHAGPTRHPRIEEITFCMFFSNVVLDRFAAYILHSQSDSLPLRLRYPKDEKPPSDLFEEKNPGLTESLQQILSGELS
ncbi:MAG: hypothetical protein E3J66_05945 [Dehalococcoidia bacterium]|nr:MAG: hypothetical protein E3J66_05945 [Dehalococcoidia bacterium]